MEFNAVLDEILKYHFDQVKTMVTNREQDGFCESYAKAEAAREILKALEGKLPKKEQKIFSERLERRFDSACEAMFFSRRLWVPEITGEEAIQHGG